ncbi:rhodanese-like domain-containing protein 9, chloroplastic [Andrographis paniculata]|uniref:rhodanese-like domain-containing protein 9, chloroplastic n=1 Tax=Andrographis paniculata TaxID=175694 RepID=UPI0021E7F3C2|nr:rhodanese-like domain-containing protein 9, chloroplastic [Andrographis paniculata]
MAGMACCCACPSSASASALPSRTRSNLAAPWLVVGTYQGRTLTLAGRQQSNRRRGRSCLVVKAEVSFVNSEDAKKLVAAEGYSILDVRDRTQFERAHIKDCYHVPLFIENKDNDLGTIVKRTLHNNFSGLFFGLPFTKPNPDFVQSVKSQFSPGSKLLLVCQEGLRSVAAADKLDSAGFQKIVCITSGLQSVPPGTFNSVGSTELKDAGKAGLITVQGKISAVLGTVLICALLFVTFFPDQAEKLLELAPTR